VKEEDRPHLACLFTRIHALARAHDKI
jgi:hypothetical protein